MQQFVKASMGVLVSGFVAAATAHAGSIDEMRAKVNENVVGIMAGSLGGTDMSLAADMGLAFSEGHDMRVVPMVGLGSVQDVEDLLFLRGIDMAIVQQDVIDFMVSKDVYPGIESRVRLLAPLSFDQFHVLASKSIPNIYGLAGQKVNFGPPDGGTFMTSSVVFETLNIEVELTSYPHQLALEKLRNGEIAAMMRASGKPVSVIEEVDLGEPFHLLSVPAEPLAGVYSPTTLTAEDYPALIEPDTPVTTVAVANALLSYNWPPDHPRGQALAKFTQRLYGQYGKLLEGGYHESWQEIDFAAEIPGLQRYWAAEEALRARTQ